jgi:hypothetical protein
MAPYDHQSVKINGRNAALHFGAETRPRRQGRARRLGTPSAGCRSENGVDQMELGELMGPGRYGGLGATAGAIAVAFVVAVAVIAMVAVGGGLNRPLVAAHVAAAAAPSAQG